MLTSFLDAPRPVKRLISSVYDCIAITIALYLAWALRLGDWHFQTVAADWVCLAIILAVSIFTFAHLGLYRAILRYMTHQAVLTVLTGIMVSGLTLAAASFFLDASIPRSVPIIYVFMALVFVAVPRMLVRNLVQLLFAGKGAKIIIYGAGSSGNQLAAALQQRDDYHPIAFVDDNHKLHGHSVRGLPVLSPERIGQLIRDHDVERVMLAIGNAPRAERLRIIRHLEGFAVKVKTVPAFDDLIHERARVEELRDIQIEDLLGRDPVKGDPKLMETNIKDKVVMVTGAGGSIGAELCRQILQHAPKTLVLFELNEYNLYQIEEELKHWVDQNQSNTELVPLLGSVQHQNRLEMAMRSFGVETVYHAAAYKHVPLVEQNLIEGVRNNLFGTKSCAEAAIAAGVKTFVLISTDKAVRPTNIMGASKRLAELMLQSLSTTQETTTFCMVRFGNVLGSSGSVVPKFREQIKQGGPITVTHPEITRYFMTTSEAAQLVIQAGAMATGGDVFVLEMGEPVKIADMAKEMVALSGLTLKNKHNPKGDIEIQFTGLRPGEKLFEELLVEQNCLGTDHPRIMRAEEESKNWQDMQYLVEQLDKYCRNFQYKELHETVLNSPAAFKPLNPINDLTFTKKQQKPVLKVINTNQFDAV